jgi:16S rRNA processing protein RimM
VPEPPPRAPANAELRAGTLVGIFGLRGELKLASTRIGDDSLRSGMQVTLRAPDGTARTAVVRTLRRHQGRPLVTFDEVADATAAGAFLRADVLLERDDVVLASGEYLDADLLGCRIVDNGGRDRGAVVDVLHYPGSDMLIVGPARAMLPLVAAFVQRVDLATRTISVDVPPGLLDLEEADEA